MQFEIGDIKEGRVTGITKFGVFVEIEKGVTGLVHISEISKSFVIDISKIIKRGDIIKVKILSYENDKLSLSIKQVGEIKKSKDNLEEEKKYNNQKEESSNKNSIDKKEDKISNFEDILSKFKKNSEERMADIRKNLDGKRNSYSKKR